MRMLSVLLFLFLFSCNRNRMSKNNLSGVYVRSFRTEYAVDTDTLRLNELGRASYRITKSTSYQRIIDGKMNKTGEYRTEHWLGVFDKENGVLNIQPSGKVLSVDLRKEEISLGSAVYQRVNTK